jgi:hypothetical protein
MSWVRRIILIVCTVLALVAVAGAEEPDTIVLKDGTLLRGHVAEMKPHQSVTIQLLNGQTRTLSWSEVASAKGPSFGQEEAQPQKEPQKEEEVDVFKPGPGRAPLLVEAQRPQSITLHVRSEVAVNGFYLTFTKEMCTTPCTMYLPPGHYWLHTEGEGVAASNLSVELGPEGKRIKMRSSSSKTHATGVALTTMGVLSTLAGAISLICAVAPAPDYSSQPALLDADGQMNAFIAGGVLGGLGVASIVTGAVMLAKSPTGAEEQSSYGGTNPQAPRTLDAWVAPTRNGGSTGLTVRF